MSAERSETKPRPTCVVIKFDPDTDIATALLRYERGVTPDVTLTREAGLGGLSVPWGTVDSVTINARKKANQLGVDLMRVNIGLLRDVRRARDQMPTPSVT